jgi:predicted DNA-binding protein (MmcQ/YjbR family)
MTRNEVNAHCATLPGAELSDPWGGGHDVWKVGGKMFASMGAMNAGVSIKCSDPSEAAMLTDLGVAEPAPYLARGGWVLVRWGAMDAVELRARLTRSYLTVRRGLPKRIQAGLGPEPADGAGQDATADRKPEAARGARSRPARGSAKRSRLG